MELKPTVRQTTAAAKIKINPPMVGVPVFAMCHEGPISLISCPAFIFLSQGI